MTKLVSVGVVALGVCFGGVLAGADTGHVKRLSKGTKMVFAAELGLTNDVLGMGFERDLADVDAQGVSRRVYPEEVVEVPVSRYEAKFETIGNSVAFAAHGRYLFAQAGVTASESKRYMVVRVSQIDKIVKLRPQGAPLAKAPMYASKVFYGWAVYVVIEGEASTFTAEMAAGLRVAGASLSSEIRRHKLTSYVHVIGATPKPGGEIVIATSIDDVRGAFVPATSPQPIFVEYTLLEDTAADAITWKNATFKPGRYTAKIDATVMPTKADGRAWDPGAGPPDPLVTILVDGKPLRGCKDQDTFRSTCLRGFVIDVDDTTTISLEVRDKDFASDDPIGATESVNVMASGVTAGSPITLKPSGQLQSATVTLTRDK